MNATKHRQHKFNFQLLQGILPWNNSTLGSDIAAGIVLAALGIPEVMGYTKISGTPIATGLYTLLLPAIAFRSEERRVGKEC